MNDSKPDYELFKEGVFTPQGKFEAVLQVIRDQVLLCLLIVTIAAIWFKCEPLVIALSVTFIFLWGCVRYLKCPEEHQRRKKKDG